MKAASALDYSELAHRRLPHFLFEYIDGGSYAEATLSRNVADLASISPRRAGKPKAHPAFRGLSDAESGGMRFAFPLYGFAMAS